MSIRVDNVYGAYKLYDTKGLGRQNKVGRSDAGSQDTFSLSVQAEDYQLARKAVARVPDVREDKVDALKSQIESGLYSVSASMVADKILHNLV